MTAVAHDAVVQWFFIPACADISGPTLAEMTAGDRVLGITNFTMGGTEAEVDNSDIDNLQDLSLVGTNKVGPIEFTIKRDDTTETAGWDLFTLRDNGFLVKLPFGGGGAAGVPAADDVAEVYPVQVGDKRPEGYGRNATQKFMVSFYVTAAVDRDAALAAA